MLYEKTARAATTAIFGRASRELAGMTDQLTGPAIVELTAAEIAQVAGGTEQDQHIWS